METSMTRSLYFLGAVFAMTLVLFGQILEPTPAQPAAAAAAASARPDPAPVHDPATAIDNLAAWPAEAGR
jgi:hypothetical protein